MLHSVHIFIGEDFVPLLNAVGKIFITQHGDSIPYNYFYNVCELPGGKLSFENIRVQEYCHFNVGDSSNDVNSLYGDAGVVEVPDLADFWSNEIFDKILKVGISAQDMLYVFIHVPLYAKKTINTAKVLCAAFEKSDRPVNVDFVGYCEDVAKFINPESSEEPEQSCLSVPLIKAMYSELNYSPQQNKMVVVQNRSMNGVAILSDDDTSAPLYDMVASLCLLFSSHYDKVFALSETTPRDVVGIGFSSLYFDVYVFSEYLYKKVLLRLMDSQSINNNDVDVNKANNIANRILEGKEQVLSDFLKKWQGREKDNPQYDEIVSEINEIIRRVEQSFSHDKDMTAKTAILASLLSKTECELFSNSFYNPDITSFEGLYNEALNYFIEEDDAVYYKLDDAKPTNPIAELQDVNKKLIQSEGTIRNLEKQLSVYGAQMEKNDKAKECFIDNGFLKFGDKKFRLLPTVDDIPLEETYEAHDVVAESIDLRENFSAIKNQGQQGSCLSFTLVSIFEYMMKLHNQEDCDLSEAFLYYNARNLDEDGTVCEDNGSKFVPSLDALRMYGIASEKVWPYNDEVCDAKPSEEAYRDGAMRKLVKALNVERNVNAIKSALSDGYPVACSFTLTNTFNTGGAYIPMPTDEDIDNVNDDAGGENKLHSYHAMTIVGYSDKLQRFLVRNSWGDDWGDKGYCYVPYAYVANQKLLNFACIITEIASLSRDIPRVSELPALEINNSDIKIRYYVTSAALDMQMQIVRNLKERKEILSGYFEMQKALFSDPNARDEFVDINIKLIQEQNKSLKETVRDREVKQEEIFNRFKKRRLFQLLKFSCAMIVCFLLMYSWNYVAESFLNEYEYENATTSENQELDTYQNNATDDVEGKELIGTDYRLSYLYLLPLGGVLLLIAYLRFRRHYNDWREERDDLQSQIDKDKRQICLNEKRIGVFRHKAYSAWLVIDSLGKVIPCLEEMYTKMVSLVNNLRIWYNDVNNMSLSENVELSFPNIGMLCREKLDTFFDEEIGDSFVQEVDLCENINDYQMSAEFLAVYQADVKEKIQKRLLDKLNAMLLDVSEHVASNKYTNMMKEVDVQLLTDWNRQAGIFLHVRSNERALITTDNNIFASSLNVTRHNLLRRLQSMDISSIEETNDRYRITLLRVATLSFDECVALKPCKDDIKNK